MLRALFRSLALGPARSPRLAAVAALLALFALAWPAQAGAAPQEAKVTFEEWQLMYMDEAKVGFVHVLQEEVVRDGRPLLCTTSDSSMTINRLGTNISVLQLQKMWEDADGKIVAIEGESNTSIAKSRTKVTVNGDRAEVVKQIAGPPQVTTIDWKKEWLGTVAMEAQVRRRIDAGEKTFTIESWSPDLGPTVMSYELQGPAEIDVPGLGKRQLIHARSTIDVQPGMLTDAYADPDTLLTVMTSTKIMGMRIMTVVSTKAECLAAFAKPDTPEVFNRLSPRTNVRLPDPYRTDELLLHVTAGDAEVPLPPLADERQTVVEQRGPNDLVLRVRRVVPDQAFTLPLAGLTQEEQECLQPNLQIESDHPALVALAKQAIGGETDAWKAAAKLERFAYEYISNKSLSALLETAAKVVETKTGDCTEHGVLLAGLCRAVGIPARVAVGFLYFQGIWGGHMWAEVSLGGKWYALDAVLGHGSVDAAHIRLAADSLKDAEIGRVFATVGMGMTMKIDLLSFRHGDKEVKVGENPVVFTVDAGRYQHLLFNVSVTAPEGIEVVPNRAITLGDNEIVEFRRPGGEEFEIDVVDVTYDFKLDDAKAMLEAGGMSRVKSSERTIDGRAGRLFRGKKNKADALCAAVVRDQVLVLVTGSVKDPADEALFEALVGSLDLDR